MRNRISSKWILFAGLLLVVGCAAPAKSLDRSASTPRVTVKPEAVRLGVAKLMGTPIVFQGSGFKPKDSIFIALIGPDQVKAIVAEAPIQPDGAFKAEVSKLTKAMEILKADIAFNDKFKEVVVITRPPLPEGIYTARVTSMMSNLTAETKLAVRGPSVIDRAKDWIGKITGKIQYKNRSR
jgi:hypothetical protein